MNLWERIFGVNDWVPVWATTAQWNVDTDFGVIIKKAAYEIVYSKSRCRLKIRINGYYPKQHQMYELVVERFVEYHGMISKLPGLKQLEK